MQDMVQDQERNSMDACASDDVLSYRAFTGPNSDYLGELRSAISSKALSLIHKQYRQARRAMPRRGNPFPRPLGGYTDDCSVSIELGIPCHYRIYAKLSSAEPFQKWEIHPRWRLRPATSQNIYRRILDPKIATNMRGRPANTPQTLPSELAVKDPARQAATQDGSNRRRGRPAGSRSKKTRTRASRLVTEAKKQIIPASSSLHQQMQSQSAALGHGKTTGVRATGRRTQPSIRRTRSQWELLSSDDDVLPEIVVSTAPR